MRIRRPSPAMVISIIALVMATTGTSIAAVDYATKQGQWTGYSAVRAGSHRQGGRQARRDRAQGRSGKGTIPKFHLSDVPHSKSFGQPFEVVDNQIGGTETLDETRRSAASRASCSDENATAGNENPTTHVDVHEHGGAGRQLRPPRRLRRRRRSALLQPEHGAPDHDAGPEHVPAASRGRRHERRLQGFAAGRSGHGGRPEPGDRHLPRR